VSPPTADGRAAVFDAKPLQPYLSGLAEAFERGRDSLPLTHPASDVEEGWGAVAASLGLLLWEWRWSGGDVVYVRRSAALLRFWREVLDEVSFAGLDRAAHPKDRGRLWRHFEQAASSGSAETEVRLRGRDGRQRWVRARTAGSLAQDGTLVMRGAFSDVTVQRVGTVILDTDAQLQLTPRQLQILQLTAEGATAAEIAERLQLSRRTVENHVARAMRSLGVRRKREAVALARESGLLVF
jgi:DNA-binding CsgD family transcriptional regulator